MTKFIAAIVSVLILLTQAHATTFIPTSLENLLEQSTAMAEVLLASKQSFQNEMGIIQTVHNFEVLESLGLDEEMAQSKFIAVTMIGGSFNGLTSYIDGAPEFEVGEKSLLLLKRIEGRLYLSNFSMGKYLIKERDGQKYYESTVFPKDKDIGVVKKQKMLEIFKSIKSIVRMPVSDEKISPLIPSDSSVISFSNKESVVRGPAETKKDSNQSPLMTFFIFGWMLIMCYVFYPKKSGK